MFVFGIIDPACLREDTRMEYWDHQLRIVIQVLELA